MLVYVIAVSYEGGKQMKRFTLLFLTLILLVFLSGCPNPWIVAHYPCTQHDTTWATADGRVVFYVPKDLPNTTGIIHIGEERIPFYNYANTIDSTVYLDVIDNFDIDESEYHMSRIEDHFETWKAISVRPGKYTVRVEETTYFTPGETLTFYCIDGNHLNDPEYLQAEIAKIQREERKSQWITRGILGGVVLIAAAIVVLLLRRKHSRK